MSIGSHHRPIKQRFRKFAKRMRRAPTDAEMALWQLLRDRRLAAFKFRRQFPIENYIVDFVCLELRIIVEVDGGQHSDSRHDDERDKVLSGQGFKVLRYWNNDVVQRPGSVLEDLLARLRNIEVDPSPDASLRSAPPSPARGEG